MRVKLVVAYDGTNYCGWQIQPNGVTIEEELNKALSDLLKEDIKVSGASRTDAGVHSLGNIAIFDTNTLMAADKISFAVNQRLPEDIVVQSSEQVPDDWNPHTVDSVKTYEYRIFNAKFRMPTERLYSYFYHHTLDVRAMQQAAKYLEGEHDFTSFASAKAQVNSFVRTLYEVSVRTEGDMIIIKCVGNGFLYNMVRIIAGTLIRVGEHKIMPEEMENILNACDRECAGPTAPSMGLTMISWVESENDSKNA